MNPTLAVEVEQLKKLYPGALAPALDGLNLSISPGIIFGLLGPNGAGKTTTINIICGITKPDSGTAKVFGQDISTHIHLIKKSLGLVPQHYALFGDLTGFQNLEYIGTLYGLEKQHLKTTAKYLLQRMGLWEHAHKRVVKYSGGMKRRINIIASLLHQPQLIILDEPTAGVDIHSRTLILDYLSELRQQGKTIIYTSHLLEEAERLCDEIAIIDEGKLIVKGATQSIINETPETKDLEDVFLHYTGYKLRD